MSFQKPRILVVGCGAMGGIFAAYLTRVAEVTTLDINDAHVEAIRQNGLHIKGKHAFTAHFRAESDPSALHDLVFDAVLFLVKSAHTASALAGIKPLLAHAPLLITLQNGMGNSEILETASSCHVARGVSLDAGRYLNPGCVEHLISGNTTWLGPTRGSVTDCTWLAEQLTAAGLPTRMLADPMEAVWSKFVFNAVMNPIGALLLGVNAARYESAEICHLIDDMAKECTTVIEKLGGSFAFDPMELVKDTRAGRRPITRHAGSMALDIARGTATEIDQLTGFIVHEGDRLGIPVPICRTIYQLVKGLEVARTWQLAHG